MQDKEQKISPIKQRILQFAEDLGISKRTFYARIGVSRGTLEAKSGITEDVLAKFIAEFPEINIEWLITGKGDVLRSNTPNRINLNDATNSIEKYIELLEENRELSKENRELRKELDEIKGQGGGDIVVGA